MPLKYIYYRQKMIRRYFTIIKLYFEVRSKITKKIGEAHKRAHWDVDF
jgi:hypothetical protein